MDNKLIINFEEYTKIVEKLAIQIHQNYKPTVLVGIMRGAAPIIDILSRILKLPIAYIVIQSYSGEGLEDKQGKLMFTGLTLNKSIEWLKNYGPTKDFINEVKTACLWKKKSSLFEPDFCPVRLDSDPWIVQPTEHYEELTIEEIIKKNRQGQIIPALSITNYYATAKLTTLKVAITHIAGDVVENLPVNIFIKAYDTNASAMPLLIL